jgi:hypothetical protein
MVDVDVVVEAFTDPWKVWVSVAERVHVFSGGTKRT